MSQLPTAATPLTDAIAHVESSFGKRMRSHDGSCNGWHMMSRAAWKDVSDDRKTKGLPIHPYTDCRDYAVSSMYCYDYLQVIRNQLVLGPDGYTDYVLAAYRGGAHHVKTLREPLTTYAKYIKAVKSHLPKDK